MVVLQEFEEFSNLLLAEAADVIAVIDVTR